jgi:hypothetical protein
LYFDFHGALRQLLPSLLPRLYATLQRDEPTLRGKMLCQETGRNLLIQTTSIFQLQNYSK